MHRARYWLLLKIARMPKVFTYGAGVLVAVGLTLATIVTTVWLDQSRVAKQHDDAIRFFETLAAESTELLAHLHSHDTMSCEDDDLLHLHEHLLKSRYLREIGIMNEDRGLICSTALGRTSEPIKGDHPVYVSLAGLELLNNIPLTMAGKKLVAVIIQRPPFNVVLSPYATGDIYASADAVWLRTRDKPVLLHANVPASRLAGMRERASQLEDSKFTLHGLSYELISMRSGHDLILQTYRSPGMIVQQSGMLLPALLTASLLIAVLAVGTITPYVLRLCGLHNRVDFLCDEAHLMLVYQPIFDLTTRRPIGCEVLARLKEGSQVWMPDKMIPAIQSAGLERRLDHAVTRKAIRELAVHLPAWDDKFSVAVNYFPKSVIPDELIPILTEALQLANRDDLDICVEITEHSLSSELITEVQCLKAQGFLIAVDDFGTGYSNLKSVTKLSPHRLKIDRSFVHELEDATVRSSLIAEIVSIGRAIDADTVAEGIENMEQARLLLAAGVRYGQGYALARPMQMAQFVAFMSRFK